MRACNYGLLAISVTAGAFFYAPCQAAGIARVDFSAGQVVAVAPDGRSRALARGSEINVGDTVATREGRAQLRFADGAYMSLQPQTEFKVEAFRFRSKTDANAGIVMSLIQGGMRTITGLIGKLNPDGYQLQTDAATIGIRGTEYSVRYTNSIEVFCADGSIFVRNEAGTLQLDGGQGAYVANSSTAPRQTDSRPVLPPQSPIGRDLNERERKVEEPTNPSQESAQGVASDVAALFAGGDTLPGTDTTPALLTGNVSVHAAFAGYDTCGERCFNAISRLASNAKLDSQGRLLAFNDAGGQSAARETQIGSGSVADTGNDGITAWGRWTSGQMDGDGELGGNPNTRPLPANGTSLHYIVGTPTPAGDISALQGLGVVATYSLMGGTSPTDASGNAGTLTGGQLVARFGPMTVDVNLGVSIGSSAYEVAGRGLRITSAGGFEASSVSTSGCQGSSCTTDLTGFFAGGSAARAGVAYRVNDVSDVFGVAAFKKASQASSLE